MGRSVSDEPQGGHEVDVSSRQSSHRRGDELPAVHQVRLPPKKTLLTEISQSVKETFFPDDPLRSFKDQSKSKKLILSVQAVFPIFEWGRHYNLKKLRGDIIAGLTIASLCIPQVNYSPNEA